MGGLLLSVTAETGLGVGLNLSIYLSNKRSK